MERKTDSLLFRFALIFTAFALLTLVMSGLSVYWVQTNAYERQCEENVRHVSDHLEKLMMAEGQDFVSFQNYFLALHP